MIKRMLLFFGLLLLISVHLRTLPVSNSVASAMAQNQGGITIRNSQRDNSPQAALINVLNQFRNLTVAGDYVAAGIGLRDTTQGSITISGIPVGASVVEAYLYWGMLDSGESPSLKNMNFNGTPITGTLIGSGEDTCWGRTNSFAYRANVTSLVSGNGTYNLTGVASGGLILAQGASLVVIYQRPGDLSRNIILLDGNAVFNFSFVSTNTISGFLAAAPVVAKTTFIVGDGQPNGLETASFTGGAGTVTFNNPFEGSDGLLWDTDTFNVSPQINPGDTTATVNITSFGDCLMWVAQAFSVTTSPPFDICLQDDSNGNIFKFNSTTGDYLFTNCSGLTVGGVGSLTKKGSIITLQHNTVDRRILVKVDTSTRKATASIQLVSQGKTFTITDRDMANSSCSCGN